MKDGAFADLDYSMFAADDLANIVLQRSEILFDVPRYGQIIREWESGDSRRLDDLVRDKGVELAARAVAQIGREFDAIRPVLDTLSPRSVADIGCGYAFFDLFLHRAFAADLLLIDIEQNERRHFGFRAQGAAYSNLSVARGFLVANGVPAASITTWNPDRQDSPRSQPVDLAISLLSCGFHYPAETYMDFFRTGVAPDGAIILDLRPRRFDEGCAVLSELGEVEVIATRDDHRRVLVRKRGRG